MKNIFDELKKLSPEQREKVKEKLRNKGVSGLEIQRVTAAPVMPEYPLSSAQKRMYTMFQIEPLTTVYNMPVALILKGQLDVPRLEKAFGKLIARHETLRTTFHLAGDQLVQRIGDIQDFKLDYQQQEQWQLDGDEIKQLISAFVRPFDITAAPAFRVKLIRLADEDRPVHILLQDKHHSVSDGISEEQLNREIIALYAGEELPALPLQYKDYAVWQQAQRNTPWFEKQKEYWLNRFKGQLPVLDLPTDFPRPRTKSFKGDYYAFEISEELTAALKQVAVNNNVTLYIVLISLFKVLLYRYTHEKDLIIASDTANRTRAELQDIVGMFINKLVIRSFPEDEQPFNTFLSQVNEIFTEALENQDYQFDMLVQDLNIPRETSRNPIFDISMGFQNMDRVDTVALRELQLLPFNQDGLASSRLDLHLDGFERNNRLHFTFEYSTDLFRRTAIERMATHFRTIAAEIVKSPAIPLGKIALLTAAEENYLFPEINGSKLPYAEEQTIQQTFEQLVQQYPDQIAVNDGASSLTYAQLNSKANQLALMLREKKVGRDQPVALLLNRSVEMTIGILAILKAGACYVPVDSRYPVDRISYILGDCGATIVLATMNETFLSIFDKEQFLGIDWIMLDDEDNFKGNDANTPAINTARDLAYIIYTSATTGQSKGVMLEHRGLQNLIANNVHSFGINAADNILQFATLSFDASVFEIFSALLTGATLHIVPEAVINEYSSFEKFLSDNNITIALLPPVYAQHLHPENINSLRILFTGGSASNLELEKKWRDRLTYVNAYGPTEATVVASYFVSNGEEPLETKYGVVPIGKPLYNTQLYVLNDCLQPVPVGVTGELFIAGDSVARGYWGREELTAATFLEDPFHQGKMYRSGDLVRWLPDGNLEFKGRKDDQVKVRGFRIEPAEVEKALLKITFIKEAAVVALAEENNKEEKFLCAYYTLQDNTTSQPTSNDIIRQLEDRLPAYMIPQFFVLLPEIPLNMNGKVDRKQLPLPQQQPAQDGLEDKPMGKLEQELASVWESVLKKDRVGANDNFFALGGDSIKAITLVSMLNKEMELGLVINNIFANQTVALLAAFISRQTEEPADMPSLQEARQALTEWKALQEVPASIKIPAENIEDIYPMSDIQAGMFFHNLMDKRLYHNQVVFEVNDAAFDLEIARQTFLRLTIQHSILRTAFFLDGFDGPAVITCRDIPVDSMIDYVDLANLSRKEQEIAIQHYMEADLNKGFDSSNPGLWRTAIFKLSDTVHAIMLACHHAIMDGWSDAVFLTEFSQVYQALQQDATFLATPLQCTYRDFIADQWRYKQAPSVKLYWNTLLDGYERLPLPLSKKATDTGEIRKNSHHFYLDKTLQEQVLHFAQENDMSLKHICLAAYMSLLKLVTGKQDITIGILSHGRPELEDAVKMIGCFLNTVPFRISFDRMLYGREILDMIKLALDAQQGFDRLSLMDIIQAIGEKTSERNSIFDVFFGYLNFHVYEQASGSIQPASVSKGFGLNNTWFDCIVEYYDEIIVSFHYLQDLYTTEEIKRLEYYYTSLLRELVVRPGEVVKNTAIIPAAELQLLEKGFNDTDTHTHELETIVSLFRQQASLYPDNIAVRFGTQSLTYQELEQQSDKLAACLLAKGVVTDTPVILITPHAPEMAVGMLGILKAGGCYVPVDPAYPEERILVMIRECGATKIVADKNIFTNEYRSLEVIAIKNVLEQTPSAAGTLPVPKASDLAYIMYTSGTTGRPKGVMIEHKSVIRLVSNPNYVPLGKDTSILLTGAVSFDATTFEVWGALLNGGVLHLLPQEELMDSRLLKKYISNNGINTMWFTASWFNQLVDIDPHTFNGLSYILVGGEKLSPVHINRLYKANGGKKLQIINGYGPTENTTFSICFPIPEGYETDIPLGQPINNTEVYILDAHRQFVPIGVPGEIYLAGAGLARGYYRQFELTAEKFVTLYFDNPERTYASGDIGYWMQDGTIAFVGRKDEQVKIRGHRIEPAEVEEALLMHTYVTNAVVNVYAATGKEKALAAYVITSDPIEVDPPALKKYLRGILPEYMVPDHFIIMDIFPLTTNGKIDRKALPEPGGREVNNYQAPRNQTEALLAAVWEDVLGIPAISIYDNFFELGAHSLKASLAISRLAAKGVENINLRDIFRNPTVELLAEEIEKKKWSAKETLTVDDTAFKVIDL